MRRILLSILALALAAAAPAVATAANLVVDDDRLDCPGADHQSINQAVAAADSGDTIRVCPGLYHESVVVDKPVKLVGARDQPADVRCDDPAAPDPERDAIVNHVGGGFNVAAPDVTIAGFTIQSAPQAPYGAGISTSPLFSGYAIANNLIQKNAVGLDLNGNGADRTAVRHNCIRGNNLRGAPGGAGIFNAVGLARAAIENNAFRGHTYTAIQLLGEQADIRIAHNEVVDDSTVLVARTTGGEIVNNLVLRPRLVGINLAGGNVGVRVVANKVADGGLAGIAMTPVVPTPNIGNVVEANSVSGFVNFGIRLLSNSHGNHVRENKVENNGTLPTHAGIRVEGSGNVVRENLARGNRGAGIRLDLPASANVIEQNRSFENVGFDCYDATAGPGTAGTANFWLRNLGVTENRPGLCRAPGAE